MRTTLFDFPYKVMRWSSDGNHCEELAGALHFSLALAAFEAALPVWAGTEITLQQGIRIMRKGCHPAPDRPPRT
ncbi:hypothetical protein EYE35_01195 [Cereibacter sphaeroides]|nr:hypothetical protein EYE35_01195 [Cereibacter sphaeroides]